MRNGIPTMAIVGYGRAGKDEACLWMKDHTPIRFAGGCSWAGRHYMAERLSADYGRVVTPEEAYETRHGRPGEDPAVMRMKWYRYLNEFRASDPTRLVRAALEESDVACGVRDREELLACRQWGLLDLIVWIDRGVPVDQTVTFSREDCDIVVENKGSLEHYYARLERLCRFAGISVR